MAKQVKPFQVSIALGYLVWCDCDSYLEPEGTVFFDSPPQVGDKAILCDGKEWTVVRGSNEQMEITMALV